jgi:hypothetical protein
VGWEEVFVFDIRIDGEVGIDRVDVVGAESGRLAAEGLAYGPLKTEEVLVVSKSWWEFGVRRFLRSEVWWVSRWDGLAGGVLGS